MGLFFIPSTKFCTCFRLHHKYVTHSRVSKPHVKCQGFDLNAPPSGLATLGNAPGCPGGGGGGGGGVVVERGTAGID